MAFRQLLYWTTGNDSGREPRRERLTFKGCNGWGRLVRQRRAGMSLRPTADKKSRGRDQQVGRLAGLLDTLK